MADINLYRSAEIDSIKWTAASVTPADDADLARLAAVITCTGEGTIAVVTSGGSSVTLFCQAGGVLPVFVDRVLATGTTATGIVALYG